MREAVVSTARTPIGAYRGAFNNTLGQSLGAHAIKHAVERAGVEAGEVEDVIMGAACDGQQRLTPLGSVCWKWVCRTQCPARASTANASA